MVLTWIFPPEIGGDRFFSRLFVEMNLSPESKQKNIIRPLTPIIHISLFLLAGMWVGYEKRIPPCLCRPLITMRRRPILNHSELLLDPFVSF